MVFNQVCIWKKHNSFTVAIIFSWRSQIDIDRTISYNIIHVTLYIRTSSGSRGITQQKPYIPLVRIPGLQLSIRKRTNPVRWVFIRIYNGPYIFGRIGMYAITTSGCESIYLVFSSNKYHAMVGNVRTVGILIWDDKSSLYFRPEWYNTRYYILPGTRYQIPVHTVLISK